MKLYKRKRPPREEKMFKEASKFSERAFDDITIRTLKYLMGNNIFTTLDYPLQHGKEAAVYRGTREAEGKKEYLAVKIFKYEGPSFRKRIQYLEGDRRFKVTGNQRGLVNIFARKEFANLKICGEIGVRAPKPMRQRNNVVVMEFLGEGGVPSALLKDVVLENPRETLELILQDVRKMYQAKLVHADLSEYNVIIHKGLPYLIDMGQAVLTHHPLAEQFILNDLNNLLKYFRKEGAAIDVEAAMKFVKGETEKLQII